MMPTNSALKAPWFIGRRFVQFAYYLVGATLAGFAITMVWQFGASLGISPFDQFVYGGAHATVHVFGILTALSIALFLVDKTKLWSWIAIALVVVVGSYGISNISGWSGSVRLGKADAAAVNEQRAMNDYKAKRADLENQRKWASEVVVNSDYSATERNAAKKLRAEIQAQLDALKAPTVTAQTVNADYAATVWSRLLPAKAETAAAGMTAWFSWLMYICEVFAFILGTRIGAGIRLLQGAWVEDARRAMTLDITPPSGGRALDQSVPAVKAETPATALKPDNDDDAAAPPVPARRHTAVVPPHPAVAISAGSGSEAEQKALQDLVKLIAEDGYIPSQKFLAKRWKADEGLVSRWLRIWSAAGAVAVRREPGKPNVITIPGGAQVLPARAA